MDTNSPNPEMSTTGLAPNVAGALAYLLGPITGIIFLAVEKDSSFVRFHAMQSTIAFGGLFVVQVVLSMVPVLGWLINMVLVPVGVLLWAFLIIKAFMGDRFKLPTIGDMAERQI